MHINIFNRIKERLIREYRQLKKVLSNTYYVSLGENCLTDNILDRFNIKSFSTPYSHTRSNIDYAIHLEREKYRDLLNPKFLYYDYVGETKVVRNKHYSQSDNIYSSLQLNGFEFTHHDVIKNKNHRESYERKIMRIRTLDSRKKIKFLYHYRDNENKDIARFIRKANVFLSYYLERNINSELIFFTQAIVKNKDERALVKVLDTKKIKGYELRTLEVWAGDDEEVFWARKDDDLLSKMIKETK